MLSDVRLKSRHREQRQNCEVSIIVIYDHIGSSWRQRNVIAMRYRILSSLGHSQRKRIATRYRRLKLLSCHKAHHCPRPTRLQDGLWFAGNGGNLLGEIFLKPGVFHLQQIQSVSLKQLETKLGALTTDEF